MLLNSSKKSKKSDEVETETPHKEGILKVPESAVPTVSVKRRALFSLGLPAWVFLGFMLAQALVLGLVVGLQYLNVSFESVNETIFNAAAAAIIYALAIVLVIGMPWWIKRRPTTTEELGINRWPKWTDIFWTPAAMVVYVILTALLSTLALYLLPFVDYAQEQQTGFAQITTQAEYIIAFVSLVVVAPVAEEVLFRGYLLGKLRKYVPLWGAILITSVLFGIVHFQWNVGIDVFALSIVLCILRVVSRGLWAPIMLHMLKNGVAYYFLFINPTLLSTLGG